MNISFTWEKNSSTSFLSSGFVQKFSSYRPESARLRGGMHHIEGGAGSEEALRPICALLRPEQIELPDEATPVPVTVKVYGFLSLALSLLVIEDRRRARAGRGRRKGRCEGGGILRRERWRWLPPASR